MCDISGGRLLCFYRDSSEEWAFRGSDHVPCWLSPLRQCESPLSVRPNPKAGSHAPGFRKPPYNRTQLLGRGNRLPGQMSREGTREREMFRGRRRKNGSSSNRRRERHRTLDQRFVEVPPFTTMAAGRTDKSEMTKEICTLCDPRTQPRQFESRRDFES